MEIRTQTPPTEAVAALLDRAEGAVHGHRPQWLEILAEGMGHRPRPLAAWRDGQVVGWLPLVETRSRLFGRHLVSLPYVNAAGLIADEPATAEALVERAIELGRARRTADLELRQNEPTTIGPLEPTRTNKVAMSLPLAERAEAMWDGLASKVRSQVRKGHKLGVTTRVGGLELLDAFYRIFARNMRDLGTPVFPKRLFRSILDRLAGDAELVQAEFEGRVVASALLIHDRGVSEVPSASSRRDFNHTNANMVVYHRLLERAIERGSTTFEFGRSTEGSGPHRFKKQWRAQPRAMGWQRIGLSASDTGPIVREDDRFGLAVRAWQRLPVCVSRGLGPIIARQIP